MRTWTMAGPVLQNKTKNQKAKNQTVWYYSSSALWRVLKTSWEKRHIQILSKKIWENKNKFKIAKKLPAYHHTHFHLWTSPNVKIQDKWNHFSQVLYSLPDHSQVLSSAQNHITHWPHLPQPISHTALQYYGLWADGTYPAVL